jgi:hypothetical protein
MKLSWRLCRLRPIDAFGSECNNQFGTAFRTHMLFLLRSSLRVSERVSFSNSKKIYGVQIA